MGIKTDGTLWGWGLNTTGQLGDGTVVSRSSPVQIGTLTNWSNVSTGTSHTIAIKNDGSLWTWGSNGSGQLGGGNIINRSSPIQIGTLTNWSKISAGLDWSISIKTDGTLWSFGTNIGGQLGDGTVVSRSSPVQIGTLTNWSKVSTGLSHSMSIKTDGTLWGWGQQAASLAPIGDNTITPRSSPVQIGTLTDWSEISAGAQSSAAIKTNGTLWTWGRNLEGQLGNGTSGSVNATSSPIQIGTLTNWSKIFSNSSGLFYLALKTDGTLWSWGSNPAGQLGDGTVVSKSSPVQIGTLTNWSTVSPGASYSIAVKSDNTFRVWGTNVVGELGRGFVAGPVSRSSPVQIGEDQWTSVYAGNTFTTAIRGDNTLWAWGVNTAGYLGDSSVLSRSAPTQIGTFSKWQSVSSGASHTIAIREE
jgi:alpha-tubulin suppressor-like RCC1 family protein